MTHSEVVTRFHELGHGLHHLLTRVDYPSIAGINGVPWDMPDLGLEGRPAFLLLCLHARLDGLGAHGQIRQARFARLLVHNPEPLQASRVRRPLFFTTIFTIVKGHLVAVKTRVTLVKPAGLTTARVPKTLQSARSGWPVRVKAVIHVMPAATGEFVKPLPGALGHA